MIATLQRSSSTICPAPARAAQIARIVAEATAFRSSQWDTFQRLKSAGVSLAELHALGALVPQLKTLCAYSNAYGDLNCFERHGLEPDLAMSLSAVERIVKQVRAASSKSSS